MRLALALAVLVALVLPSPASAQSGVSPTLTLGNPLITEPKGIPLAPASTPLMVTWSYDFGDPASAAAVLGAGNASIAWSLECGETGLHFLGDTKTPVPYEAGKATYAGTATLAIAASEDSIGDLPLDCTLQAEAPGAADASSARGEVLFHPRVAFRGQLELGVPVAVRQAGPQKQIPFEVEVTNLGNALTHVRFQVLDATSDDWYYIAPDAVVVRPEETVTAIFVVSTPFHNGPNEGESTVTLRAVPVSMLDEEVQGPPADAQFMPKVKGWYIPGPSPLLMVAGLALAAFALRRTR